MMLRIPISKARDFIEVYLFLDERETTDEGGHEIKEVCSSVLFIILGEFSWHLFRLKLPTEVRC